MTVNEVRMTYEGANELQVEIDYTIIGETLVQTVDFLLEPT